MTGRRPLSITIIGAGPAGLYFAYLMQRSHPDYRIRVIEQNPPGETYGFGVVFSGSGLSFIGRGDPEVVRRLSSQMESWGEQHIIHRGETVVIDGSHYAAIERRVLLQTLQAFCREAGVTIQYETRVGDLASFADCDVLVGADGANSVVRDSYREAFGTRSADLQNYFAWYGVERPYPAHSLTFLAIDAGVACIHHYRYAPQMSTVVAEVDAETWHRSGLAVMDEEARRRLTQTIFTESLGGQPLISNRSQWRRWRLIRNDRWHHRNIVLIGDALKTAHPSIGSGTRLAMEDAVALWQAFAVTGTDVDAAFRHFTAARQPGRDRLDRAGLGSIAWYEAMAEKMALAPYDFVYDYLLRTGVMTADGLATRTPGFIARYRQARAAAAGA